MDNEPFAMSETEYERKREKLARQLAAVLPKEYEGADEYSFLRLPKSPQSTEALRITKRMRDLARFFSTQDERD